MDAFIKTYHFTLLLLQLLLLGNDVAENPGPETKVGEVSVFHWNSRSIRHKLDHLQTISNDSSIICVTESHLDENILTTDIKLPGYHEPFRNDRNCFGGGVLVYTAYYLHVLRRNDLEFNGGELIWLEVVFPRFKILVCAVYRSPGAVNNFWENFHISIERAFESSPRIIITGDLNVNLLIENDHRLNQIINIFNLTNCIREPTRLGALLDPTLFSDELETTFSDVIQVDRIKSDHDATIAFFPISYDLQTNYKRDVWLYKHGNYDGLNSEIDQFDWNSHLSSLNDIDEMSSKFSNKYIELAKKIHSCENCNYQA